MDEILEPLAKAKPEDPMAQVRLAKSRRQIGFVMAQKLGDSAAGETYLRQAHRDRSRVPGQETRRRHFPARAG